MKLRNIKDGMGPYDPTLMSISDQKLILEKLESEGFIKNLNFQDLTAWFEIPKSTRDKYSKKKNTAPKYSLLFNADKGVLLIGDNKIKMRKFSDPYHVLKIIFIKNIINNYREPRNPTINYPE